MALAILSRHLDLNQNLVFTKHPLCLLSYDGGCTAAIPVQRSLF